MKHTHTLIDKNYHSELCGFFFLVETLSHFLNFLLRRELARISTLISSILYVGETGRSLRSRFSEHLVVFATTLLGNLWPMAQHFNSTGHVYSISDVQVWGMQLYNGTNLQRKQREMRLISNLELFSRKFYVISKPPKCLPDNRNKKNIVKFVIN